MKPPPAMPEHWFNVFLALLPEPGREPHRPYNDTVRLWRENVRRVALRQWGEAVLTGMVEGAKIAPARMEFRCDQENCRLLGLRRKLDVDACPHGYAIGQPCGVCGTGVRS